MKMRKVERPEFAHFLQIHPELEGKAVSTVSNSYAFAPHLSADYALQLSRAFHAYYDKHCVIGDDAELTKARLALLQGLRIVLRESLRLLGMQAPEEM